MAVNSQAWKKFPVAARETPFNFDDAVPRITQWAAGSTEKFNTGFLWRNSDGPANNKNSYRLPVIDIVNGKAVLIPHAVQSAARILSGAHGALEGVVGEEEIDELKSVVTSIYEVFQAQWGDPRTVPPWLLGGNEEGKAVPASADSEWIGEPVTAAVAPIAPPREWFDDPKLDGPAHLTVTADGRIFGHAAPWHVCHAGIRNDCVMAPKDRTGYKFFKNGTVLTADGTSVRVGKITMDTVHAPTRDSFGRTPGLIPTEAHYADTGKQIAVVAVGEDQYGIWVAGAVVPEASPEQVARLRRSPLSGDWRPEPHGYELAGLLAVTDPGFPVAAVTASGEPGAIQGAFMAQQHAHDAEPECSPCENKEKLTAAAVLFDTNMAKIEQMQRAARLAALKEG